MRLDGLNCFEFFKFFCFPNELFFSASILWAIYSIDICTVQIKNIRNMHAVLTNQITSIWRFNDNRIYYIEEIPQLFWMKFAIFFRAFLLILELLASFLICARACGWRNDWKSLISLPAGPGWALPRRFLNSGVFLWAEDTCLPFTDGRCLSINVYIILLEVTSGLFKELFEFVLGMDRNLFIFPSIESDMISNISKSASPASFKASMLSQKLAIMYFEIKMFQ